jgi:hypothetical protein
MYVTKTGKKEEEKRERYGEFMTKAMTGLL